MGEETKIFKKIICQIGAAEVLFCLGLFFISFASYKINYILGSYVTGAALILVSLIITKADRK